MFKKPKTPVDKKVSGTQKVTTSKMTGGAATPKPTGGVQSPPTPASMTGAPAPKPGTGAGWVSPYKRYPYRYKGQIHCHSCDPITNKDNLVSAGLGLVGGLAGVIAGYAAPTVYWSSMDPIQVSRCYKRKGYKFVCITDHHIIRNVAEEPGILHIYSVEDGMSFQHHLEVLGVNFNAARSGEAAYFDKNQDGVCDWESKDCSNLPGRIYYYSHVQEAVTVLGHPRQPHGRIGVPGDLQGYTFDELRNNAQAKYRGKDYSYTGIEIYNAGFNQFADDWWDLLLEEGKRIWGFGSDDCHDYYIEGVGSVKLTDPDTTKITDTVNKKNFNRGWIVVFSNKNMDTAKQSDMQADILRNIRDGNFCIVVRSPDTTGDTPGDGNEYAGPWFDISVSGNRVTVTTDPDCTHIMAISGPRRVEKHKLLPTPDGKKAVTLEPPPGSKYIRFVWETSFKGEPYRIFSQPLFNMGMVKTR